jgi:hypothetical protein
VLHRKGPPGVAVPAIGAKIDADFGLDHLMENFLNEVTRLALHSYTHSGLRQLGRRFDGNDIKPNYSDDEVIEVIRVTTSAVFMGHESRHQPLRV